MDTIAAENLKICNRNNPYLDKCIQESITELQQYTRHGYDPFFFFHFINYTHDLILDILLLGDVKYGIPYLERMYFPSLVRGKQIGPKKQLLLWINHTNVHGLSEYTVSGVKYVFFMIFHNFY